MNDPFDRSFRDRTLAGETLFGLFLDLSSPASAELCAGAGYDWLLVDLEHGAGTEADLLGMFHAIAAGGPSVPLVRPQSGERIRIGRALDMGATGIMVPRLESADEAREAVTFLRYPPDGIRGVATRVRGAGLGVGRPRRGPAPERAGRRDHPDRVGRRPPRRRRDRSDRRGRRPLRRPGRSVALARDPRPVRARRLHGRARSGRGRMPRPRQGGRDPRLRPGRRPAAARARVHVRRDRGRCGAGGGRRQADPGRRPRLTSARHLAARPACHAPDRTSASSGDAGSPEPAGRSAVWATRTPTMIRAAPTSWIGAEGLAQEHEREGHDDQRLDRADERRLGRPDPARAGVERLDREERPEEADRDEERPCRARDPVRGVRPRPSRGQRRRTRPRSR